jgi:hypothetical protein
MGDSEYDFKFDSKTLLTIMISMMGSWGLRWSGFMKVSNFSVRLLSQSIYYTDGGTVNDLYEVRIRLNVDAQTNSRAACRWLVQQTDVSSNIPPRG